MPFVEAQEWRGSIGAAYLWQSVDGSLDSYRSQTNLSDGFMLEDLSLLFRGQDGAVSEFKLDAWGFGDANPSEAARLQLQFAAGYRLRLDYDRRESYFALAGGDLAQRRDSWNIARVRGELVIDAWRPLQISLSYRSVRRDGTLHRPDYGLNELYPVGFDLDETLNEATLRLVTRTLPVRLELEQSVANLERRNRPFPAGDSAIGGPDPDLLGDAGSTLVQSIDGEPTTRLIASYANSSFEGVASLLWRSSDLGISGTASQSYLVGGGNIGTTEFIDDVIGSAQQDAFSRALALGVARGPRWSLRLTADHRDGSTDSTLLTERLLRVVNPAGDATEWGSSFDDSDVLDFEDSSARLTVEYRADNWAVWAGGEAGSREVSWATNGEEPYEARRDATGFLAGGSWSPGRRLDLSLELQRGDFDENVFRTDPETVDRATLKLRSDLGRGWNLSIHGRRLSAQQDDGDAQLDSSSTPFGVACAWSSGTGRTSAGIDLERYSLTTDTALVLPGGEPGHSRYDLDLTTVTVYGHTRAGRVGIRANLTYLSDDGDTFPVDAWNGSVRITWHGAGAVEYSALAQYWSYDEVFAEVDDFDVLRYGLAVTWRFE